MVTITLPYCHTSLVKTAHASAARTLTVKSATAGVYALASRGAKVTAAGSVDA